MKRGKWWILGLLLAIGLLPLGCLRSTVVCTDGCNDDDAEALVDGKPVRIQRVAADIDALERHIERYGSIVPKRADVWGQARLMAHRHEFELEMQKDLPNFNDTLQGWLSRRDQAFLAGAFSLQAALGGTPASQLLGAGQSNSINTAISLAAEPHSVPSGSTGTPPITSTASTAIAPPSFSGRDASGKLSPLPISLEPSQHLSQKARYLNHLHELRRINEGDDNADSPGYALDLVRIPVSVFTGNFTRTGFGAEITFTANPHLTDDLLPTTFKNLVIRDLVDLGTVPIAHFIGAADVKELVDTIQRMDNCQKECLAEPLWEPRQLKPMLPVPRQWKPMPPVLNGGDQGALAPSGNENVKRLSATVPPGPVKSKKGASPVTSAFIAGSGGNLPLEERDARFQAMLSPGAANVPGRQRVSQLPLAPSQLIDVIGADNAARIIASVYKTVHNHTLFDDSQQKGRVAYHLDIQGVLTDELDAAYKFLSAERMLPLWNWCTRELAEAIRSRDVRYIKESRDAFDDAVDDLVPSWIEYIPDSCNASSTTQTGKDCAPTPKKPVCRYCSDTVTACLAWAIIVESALLEHRLMEDMKVVQVAKGTLHVPEGLPFHGPNPPPEARQAFKDYVLARWPIHVFAIDPVTEDQNIAEDFSLRQEMQLAVALAFASGSINASSMLRYVRRIEKDIDTITLNRTIIGFSHGDNIFGWRFYPRVQTPPLHGTAETIIHDMLMGSRNDKDRDLAKRQLENGQRECTAIVIMPSFVPYVDLDCCSNWFRLTNPEVKELNLKQSMRLSRQVQMLRTTAPNCQDATLYRDADVMMLQKRLEQLSVRLPFQQQLVEVPYENTAGGFTLFNTGITDLAPELDGWYGAPGIDPSRNTSLFLVGKNFSVHQTRVIIGGIEAIAQPAITFSVAPVPNSNNITVTQANMSTATIAVELLSREVMRVTIPPNALPYLNASYQRNMIDVHIATPYGVSRNLGVPHYVYAPPPKAPAMAKNSAIAYVLGANGIDPKKDTTLILAGTDLDDVITVIAGGVKLEPYKDAAGNTRNRIELVNPQNLLLTIPAGVQTDGKAVTVQLLTRSGKNVVTSIPLLPAEEKPISPKPPVIATWIGVEAIDPTRITTGFLLGDNFQDTMRVVAGDSQVTDFKDATGTVIKGVEVLGPGIARITLQPNLRWTGNRLELWAATSNGASNRITLPLPAPKQPMPPAAPKPDALPIQSPSGARPSIGTPVPIDPPVANVPAASLDSVQWRGSLNRSSVPVESAPPPLSPELLAPEPDNVSPLQPRIEKLADSPPIK